MSSACPICGTAHDQLGSPSFRRPDYWMGMSEAARRLGLASDDLCETGDGRFFVRCVLSLPLLDGPEEMLEFGLWCSLSESNFRRYVETFQDDDQSKLGALFGYVANEIRQFPGSRGLKCNVQPRDDGERPSAHLHTTGQEHAPLFRAQAQGITYSNALRIVHNMDMVIDPDERD